MARGWETSHVNVKEEKSCLKKSLYENSGGGGTNPYYYKVEGGCYRLGDRNSYYRKKRGGCLLAFTCDKS